MSTTDITPTVQSIAQNIISHLPNVTIIIQIMLQMIIIIVLSTSHK